MDHRLLEGWFLVTASSSVSVFVVALLRKPMRVAVGARAAYWLWLLVPAVVVGTLVPAPPQVPLMTSHSIQSYVVAAISTAAVSTAPAMSAWYVTTVICTWAAGAAGMFTFLLVRQLQFVRSLGNMAEGSAGVWRSSSAAAPMLVGALSPRIVVPSNFEDLYSPEEQALVLSHERGHLARHDIPVNALCAGWLCLSWFNPLMYWAMGRQRIDQELDCDALVLETSTAGAKVYANALLKTQFASESVWRLPVGCHWQSIHPLKERVAMLKHPLPGLSRRFAGLLGALALAILGGSWAWAALPAAPDSDQLVLVHIKLTVTTPPDNVVSEETEILVRPGEAFVYGNTFPYDARCTPTLPSSEVSQDAQLPVGVPGPSDGQILLTCKISDKGKVVSTPSVITRDGLPASIEVDDVDSAHHFKLELDASTSREKIAAARAEADKRCKAGYQRSCRP
jgi:bla regulator protein blaR1